MSGEDQRQSGQGAGDGSRQDVRQDVRGVARGTAPAPLSILDLATVGAGYTAGQALAASTELARGAEQWGYHRFWVAEHHGMPGWPAPPPPCCSPTSARTPAPCGWAPAA